MAQCPMNNSDDMSIHLPRGDIRDIPFGVYTTVDGEEVIYTDDFDEIYFTVKKRFTDEEYVFQKRLTDGTITRDTNYIYHISIEADDTNNIQFGEYVFDIEVVTGTVIKQTTTGSLTIGYESTYASNEV